MNQGAGVGVNTVTAGGTDFTISETLDNPPGTSIQVPVSIAGDTTVGDVINSINTAAQSAGAGFTAGLATTGNGIMLTDTNPAATSVVVTADSQSTAAFDLGLVPTGDTSATSTAAGTAYGWESSGANSELLFRPSIREAPATCRSSSKTTPPSPQATRPSNIAPPQTR